MYTHTDHHHHNINCLIKKLLSSDRSIIAVIIASLLISSIITITQSPFQKASAQDTSNPIKKPSPSRITSAQDTSNPIKKPSPSRITDLTGNTNNNQGQGQQQPQQGVDDQDKENKGKHKGQNKNNGEEQPQDFVPISTSGNNVYVVWPSNKTGDFEIMFRASSDNGKKFDPQFNVSNSTGIDSVRPEIAASGDNVLITWWEKTTHGKDQPMLRVSTDNGKTFGEKIMLSSNNTGSTS